MSFQDPAARRRRLSRLPAFAQHEEQQASYTSPDVFGDTAQAPSWDHTSYADTFASSFADTDPGLRLRESGPFFALSDDERGTVRRGRGILGGAVAGFLAAAAALGAANLAAAFVRRQASPTIAFGGAFVDRTPGWLKNFAAQEFGGNDKTVLLLGMYAAIALAAMVIGVIAWRHVSVGVLALALAGALGAYLAFSRPDSHSTDMIPSIAGGVAGVAAIICLVRAGRSIHGYQTDSGVS